MVRFCEQAVSDWQETSVSSFFVLLLWLDSLYIPRRQWFCIQTLFLVVWGCISTLPYGPEMVLPSPIKLNVPCNASCWLYISKTQSRPLKLSNQNSHFGRSFIYSSSKPHCINIHRIMLLELSLKVVANFFETLANYFSLGRNSSLLENYLSKKLKSKYVGKEWGKNLLPVWPRTERV